MGLTNAEVRSFLHGIKEQDEELYHKMMQIAELRTAVENCTSKLDKDGSQTTKGGDKLSNLMCRILDLEKECEKLHISVNSTKKSVLELAEDLTQDRHREYLTLRFIEYNGFYDTAMKMGVSDSTARRIDRRVISDLTKAMNKTNRNLPTK